MSDADYSALVPSRVTDHDDEDDVEVEFSMLKCSMVKVGTYYENPRTETSGSGN